MYSMVIFRWFVGDECCICQNQDNQDLRMYRMVIFRLFITFKGNHQTTSSKSQHPHKQSFSNILLILSSWTSWFRQKFKTWQDAKFLLYLCYEWKSVRAYMVVFCIIHIIIFTHISKIPDFFLPIILYQNQLS